MSNLRQKIAAEEEQQKRNFKQVEQQVATVVNSLDSIINANNGAYMDLLVAARNILSEYDPNEYLGDSADLKNKILNIVSNV